MDFKKPLVICLTGITSLLAARFSETISLPPDITYINSMTSVGDNLHINSYIPTIPYGSYGTHHCLNSNHQLELLKLGCAGNEGPQNYIEMNGLTYYENNDCTVGYQSEFNQLWVTNGTSAGTIKLVDSPVGELTRFGDAIYFRHYTSEHGYELWRYQEGVGSELVLDINPGSEHSYPGNMQVYKNKLYFFAFNNNNGYEMWVTDGTTSGTTLFKDSNPGPGNGQVRGDYTYNGRFYILSHMVLSNIYKPIIYNNLLYFFANDGTHGYELWSTDGTTESAHMIKDINPGAANSIGYRSLLERGYGPALTIFNNEIYFIATDGTHGFELWRTTNNGTDAQLVKDIKPGTEDSEITKLVPYNGILYFAANDGINGLELWRTSGTSATTNQFIDLLNHPLCTNKDAKVNDLVVHDNALYFSATKARDITRCIDGVCEPWYVLNDYLIRTDGTLDGTEEFCTISESAVRRKHLLTSHFDGLYFLNYSTPYNFTIQRVYESDSPVFESSPILTGKIGQSYQYQIAASSIYNSNITLSANIIPDWLTLTINEHSGTGILKGVPMTAGVYTVEIAATNAYGQSSVQNFNITVDNNREYQISAFSKDESIGEFSLSKPRIYVLNKSANPISDFKIEYFFSSEYGKTPIVDDYHTPNSQIQLIDLGYNNYKIIYDFTGSSVAPGEALPNSSGNVVGIHYSDWSAIDKSNDYSNNISGQFAENDHVCIYSSTGNLLWGTPFISNAPPVADAGENITATDNSGNGIHVLLDGSGSYDPDGSIIRYEWSSGGKIIATSVEASPIFQTGIHSVTLTVTDNNNNTSHDKITVIVNKPGESVNFTITPEIVPPNVPVTVSWQIPPSLNGATVTAHLQRAWDICPRSFSGTSGSHTEVIWEWNKYFFGGSGPWLIRFEIDGVIVDEKTINFNY